MDKEGKECTFLWFIENYSYCWHKFGESLISPKFTPNGLEGTIWTLKLFPRKHFIKSGIYVDVQRNEDSGPNSISMNYELSIVANDGTTFSSEKNSFIFRKESSSGQFIDANETVLQQCLQHLDNDVLTVYCKLWSGNGYRKKVAPICARTRIGIERISFLHSVENFNLPEPNLKPLRIQSRSKEKCVILSSLYFTDGVCCDKKLVIEITPSRNDHVLSKFKIAVLDASGKIINCGEVDNRFDDMRYDIQKLPLSLTKDTITDIKSEYLVNGKLSLLCDCTFSTGIEFQEIEGSREIATTSLNIITNKSKLKEASFTAEKLAACSNVIDDLKDIYSNKFLSDVELRTKTNSFPAHKIVLCARSPVFKVMMNDDMKEKNSKCIQVDDLEDDTVQNLLLFLYSDNLQDLQWESATKLYYAADKYQIEKLKLLCSSFLTKNLTLSTVTELLLLADTHNDSDLRSFVEDFIMENEEQVFCSDKWEKLMEENSQLALKTLYLKYEKKKKKISTVTKLHPLSPNLKCEGTSMRPLKEIIQKSMFMNEKFGT